MKKARKQRLGGRARQVLELAYRQGEISAADVSSAIPELPSYSAARSLLRSLEAKGLLRHVEKGMRYVYRPTIPRGKAGSTALKNVLDTFFGGSLEHAVKALLTLSPADRAVDLERLKQLIDEAERESHEGEAG